jgi:hypothetical protein
MGEEVTRRMRNAEREMQSAEFRIERVEEGRECEGEARGRGGYCCGEVEKGRIYIFGHVKEKTWQK